MSDLKGFGLKSYNPDVLSCLANLSNDEVFTPPHLANAMLDLLPVEIWSDKDATFLDPCTKTGVFLREIVRRLMRGLEGAIPDLQQRIDHILTRQVYGIAITQLTALLARRSLYCSKSANGQYSIGTAFGTRDGNIRFERTEHTWSQLGRCRFCGASQTEYDRAQGLETHAYEFVHAEDPKGIFNMQFDVIIGNPPYQLSDGGGTGSSAMPIYQKFVEQAKKLQPRYLSMIIPSRWFSGGKGLNSFREEMLNDKRIRCLVDYVDSRQAFPGVDIAGGVCYFLWDRDNQGLCSVQTVHNNGNTVRERYLNEFESFVRDNAAIDIIHKVIEQSEVSLDSIVSSRKPFGIESTETPTGTGDVFLFSSSGDGRSSSGIVKSGFELIGRWKVLISKTSNDHGGQPDKDGTRRIFSRIEIMQPMSVCTESYLVVGSFDSREEAENLAGYLRTGFCRFLVSTILLTQNITRGKFAFVPLQEFSQPWTDEKLYAKYGLTEDEIAFIESMIRPMELGGASNG